VAALSVTALVLVPLAAQMPRDYLYGWGQSSSRFGGSRYMSILSRLGAPSEVVETDYQSSTALFAGHATNWTAFVDTPFGLCYEPLIESAIASDRAGYLLVGDVNKPGVIDDACLASVAQSATWSVPLLHSTRDNATVFELVGPGTGNPGVANALAGATQVLATEGTVYTAEWDFAAPRDLTQISVGEAAAPTGSTEAVQIELRRPDGSWFTVARTGHAVGDGHGDPPYLLRSFPQPVPAVGMRVVVAGTLPAGTAASTAPGPVIGEPAALGPSGATGGGR
jgi:hypothetical protein